MIARPGEKLGWIRLSNRKKRNPQYILYLTRVPNFPFPSKAKIAISYSHPYLYILPQSEATPNSFITTLRRSSAHIYAAHVTGFIEASHMPFYRHTWPYEIQFQDSISGHISLWDAYSPRVKTCAPRICISLDRTDNHRQQFDFRASPTLKARLQHQAHLNDTSLSQHCRNILERHLEDTEGLDI